MDYPAFLEQMDVLKAFGEQAAIPNVTALNAQFLRYLVLANKATSLLEVGTANGYSTMFLAEAAKRHGGHIHTIEISAEAIAQAKQSAANCSLDNITFLEGDGAAVISELAGPFDFVFIDARKRGYLAYFQAVLPKLLPGATVVLDDVIKFKHKMLDLYAYMEEEHPHHHFVLPVDIDDGVMIYRHPHA